LLSTIDLETRASATAQEEDAMQVIALNSSPRTGGGSKTELMLQHLVAGMREAGAAVEIVNLREKKIKSCIGCFTCWTRTPGRCIHQDDMSREIFPKWRAADLAVYATPLYFHTMNSAMSRFLERTLPAAQPFFEPDAHGITRHPLRHKVPAAVWLSVCGFPELSEFDVFSDYLKRTQPKEIPILAEIYRPAAETMTQPYLEKATTDILAATNEAGRELVSARQVAPEIMARITRPLVDPEDFRAMGNLFWKTCIAEGVTPKTFAERRMVPRPDSVEAFMQIFPAGLNVGAAGDGRVVLQFIFFGDNPEACYFAVEQGGITANMGRCDEADLTIETPFALWMDIMTHKADGQQMFLEQKYSVQGDLGLMLALFKRAQ
jgi:multimeric flavodoxin WrbA